MSLESFRQEARDWLADNCPQSMRQGAVHFEDAYEVYQTEDAHLWRDRAASKGWTAPVWPTQYGGGGLDKAQAQILGEEMTRIKALPPATGMGLAMIGPTLLEYGNEEQKLRHLPAIARGETAWCQGYSEPGAGSDLASLQTKAEDQGDHFLINGSKIWTSGANHADWIFCLVRTNPDVPKHEGISFLLFSMDSPGVTTKPIGLINGGSPFCQTFFDDVKVPKDDLVHEINRGWTVAKRLLQHERSGLAALASADTAGPLERIKPSRTLPELARHYAEGGPIDAPLRADIVRNEMLKQAFTLTQQRTVEESAASTPGAATSIFKYVEAEFVKEQLEIQMRIRGTQGLGWQGDTFSDEEISMCRLWLEAKSISIAGGSNEIQLNIIAKRVLGLPEEKNNG